ncbi:unnamed protein product [Effrenium voratum]|uniref:Secreted protein n=1 Tax=Effrenium voratum TaxID=2562239 RepID=A0AA36I3N1_9DINO|nr:unnamed protein product [Effrenium voratum]CAJ1417019.1 unnamed protein product [Effrenium voratum]
MARRFGVLWCILLIEVSQASVVDILTQVKTFRDAGLALFDGLADELKTRGEEKASGKAKKFSDDWLSVLGVQKGLTGLAKDFTVNYLGRVSYHSVNGPLVDAIKEAAAAVPNARSGEEDLKSFLRHLKKVCFEGKRLFQSGGSLHEMLSDLLELLDAAEVKKAKGCEPLLRFRCSEALPTVLRANQQLKEALNYFSGPRVEANSEL